MLTVSLPPWASDFYGNLLQVILHIMEGKNQIKLFYNHTTHSIVTAKNKFVAYHFKTDQLTFIVLY